MGKNMKCKFHFFFHLYNQSFRKLLCGATGLHKAQKPEVKGIPCITFKPCASFFGRSEKHNILKRVPQERQPPAPAILPPHHGDIPKKPCCIRLFWSPYRPGNYQVQNIPLPVPVDLCADTPFPSGHRQAQNWSFAQ